MHVNDDNDDIVITTARHSAVLKRSRQSGIGKDLRNLYSCM